MVLRRWGRGGRGRWGFWVRGGGRRTCVLLSSFPLLLSPSLPPIPRLHASHVCLVRAVEEISSILTPFYLFLPTQFSALRAFQLEVESAAKHHSRINKVKRWLSEKKRWLLL